MKNMIKGLGLTVLSIISIESWRGENSIANAQQSLYLAYPPNHHQTTAERIFLIGTAAPEGEVLINGQPIKRSKAGHFAPSFSLRLGENKFSLQYQDEEINLKINRLSSTPTMPNELAFIPQSLSPAQSMARLPGESICFMAIAPKNAQVSVKIQEQIIPLFSLPQNLDLPPNHTVLIDQNQPISREIIKYQGCTTFHQIGMIGTPIFNLNLNNETVTQSGAGTIEILSPDQVEVVQIIVSEGVARTGPSTNYSRLTPLPQGTIAAVTGKEGEWLRLDYGAWIHQNETKNLGIASPPKTLIKSIQSQVNDRETKMIFPLQIPVPIRVKQEGNLISLTLYNTTAQTDIIKYPLSPLIKALTWQQVTPNQTEYTFELNTDQQWGYKVNYEGTNLVFSLRHPPQVELSTQRPLQGLKIVLDPGHGGEELGAKGPNGYPEKAVNLVVSQLLKQELINRGAIVYMTRETDQTVSLQERINLINQWQPDLSLSIHYNALPDSGDALNTAGIGMFWYHPQAQNLSIFLHDYLTQTLKRPSYGVFWNNLALTRPYIAPSILLELGFMINPNEFEWVVNPREQKKLAQTLADGITEWFRQRASVKN